MENLTNIIESILLVSGDAVAVKDISEKLGITDKEVLTAAQKLQNKYDENSGINLLIFNKKLQFCSNKKYAEFVSAVLNPIKEKELSRAMLEVAAIIAYKQPVTRGDIESIRGLNSEYAVQKLLEIGVIEPVGRLMHKVGHPITFATTDKFLKRFQISSLDELPDYSAVLAKIAEINKEAVNLFNRTDESNLPTSIVDAGEIRVETGAEKNKESEPSEPVNSKSNNAENAEDDDFEIPDIDSEETPDFLKDEDIAVVEVK